MLFYLVASTLTGTAVFAVGDSANPGHRSTAGLAVLAAMLWPVIAIGLAQLLVVVTAFRFGLHHPRPVGRSQLPAVIDPR